MKAVLLIMLFSLVTAFCFGIIQFNIAADVAGNYQENISWSGILEGSSENSFDVGMGVSPGFEYILKSGSFYYGVGAEYQVQRDVKFDSFKRKVGFIPLFGTFRYQYATDLKINPELIVQGGYNFFTADDNYKGDGTLTGGLFWGLGAGFAIHKNYIIQAMYKTNYGNLKQDIFETTYDTDVTNTQINILFGYRM